MEGLTRAQVIEGIHVKTEGWSEEALFRLARVLRAQAHSGVPLKAARAFES